MLKFVALVCLAHLATANFNVKFNQLLDNEFVAVNKVLTQKGIHSVKLGNQKVGGGVATGLSVSDVATITRIGDAVMQATDDSTVQVSSNIGLGNLTFHVDQFSSPQLTVSDASFVVESNEISWTYSISFTSSGGCTLQVQNLEVSSLDKVTLYSSDPAHSGEDVSAMFGQLKDQANQFFKSAQFAGLVAKNDICQGTSFISQFLFV